MSVLNYQSRGLFALCAVSVLAACGGGSTASTSGSGNDLSDKYVGTWKRCTAYNGAFNGFLAYSSKLVITKVAASSYSVTSSNADHTDVACTSAETAIVGESGTTVYTIVGTKTASSVTVDTVTYPTGGSTTAKGLAYVNTAGPTLQVGDTGSGSDASGFPNALEAARFAKQ